DPASAGRRHSLYPGASVPVDSPKPARSGPVAPNSRLAQQARGLEERQAHHPGIAAGQVRDECCRTSLDRVTAGLAEGFAGGDVAFDLHGIRYHERHGGRAGRNAFAFCARAAHDGNHAMRAARQCAQHRCRFVRVARFAEHAVVQHDFSIGANDNGIGIPTDRSFPSSARLLACHALDVALRRFARAAHFRHVHIDRFKDHTDLREQFAAARRLRGEPKHRASITGGHAGTASCGGGTNAITLQPARGSVVRCALATRKCPLDSMPNSSTASAPCCARNSGQPNVSVSALDLIRQPASSNAAKRVCVMSLPNRALARRLPANDERALASCGASTRRRYTRSRPNSCRYCMHASEFNSRRCDIASSRPMPVRSRCVAACCEVGLPKNTGSPAMRALLMPSQSSSASSTWNFCSASAVAMLRATSSEPKISTPSGSGSATFNQRASGRAVALCNTTVPMISVNTSGTSASAPGTPRSPSRNANNDDTEAATTPRGDTYASSVRSGQVSELRNVATRIDTGRMKNCATTNTRMPAINMPGGSGQCRRAASTTNSIDTSNVDRCSLKCMMSSMWTCRRLPSVMPMMVTASRPDSCASLLESVNAPSTAISVP